MMNRSKLSKCLTLAFIVVLVVIAISDVSPSVEAKPTNPSQRWRSPVIKIVTYDVQTGTVTIRVIPPGRGTPPPRTLK